MQTLSYRPQTSDISDYLAAVALAERAALHSAFDQHVIELPKGGYTTLNEEHVRHMTQHQIDRICYTAQGCRLDD